MKLKHTFLIVGNMWLVAGVTTGNLLCAALGVFYVLASMFTDS